MSAARSDRFDASIRIISESLSVQELTSTIGHEPTRSSSPVTSSNADGTRHDFRWILDSELPDSSSLEEHLEALLGFLEQRHSVFARLPQDCTIDLWCTAYSSSSFLGIVLDRSLIKRAAMLGLSFVISAYREPESG